MKNVSHLVLAATFLAVPLSLAPGLHSFDVTPKLIAVVAGACLVWISLAIRGAFSVPRAPMLLLAALAFAGLASTLFSADAVLSLVGTEWRRMGLPAWIACLALAAAIPAVIDGSPERRRLVVQSITVAGIAASWYGLAQYLGHDPWINASLYHIGEGEWSIVRPPSTFGYVSYFAFYVAAAVFLAADLARTSVSRFEKSLWIAGASSMLLALLVTGSRGAWLGAFAGMVAVATSARQQRRTMLIALLAVAAVAGGFIASPLGQPVRSRIRWFLEDPDGGVRLPLWRDSLRFTLAHPLLGTGLDTFGREFGKVESLDTAVRGPDSYMESPHNIFLDYATSAGLPAMLALAALLWIALRARPRDAAASTRESFVRAALLAAVVAAQFVADTIPTRLLILSLAMLALPDTFVATGAAGRRRHAAAWIRAAVGVTAALSLVVALWFGVRLLRADRAIYLAQQAASKGEIAVLLAEGQRGSDAYPFLFSQLVGQQAMSPNLPPANRAALLDTAGNAARAAEAHAEQPQMVHLQLASVAVFSGRSADARAELTEAIRWSPSWYAPRWQLALLLDQSGDRSGAADQATAALERGARAHPEIAAYMSKLQQAAR